MINKNIIMQFWTITQKIGLFLGPQKSVSSSPTLAQPPEPKPFFSDLWDKIKRIEVKENE